MKLYKVELSLRATFPYGLWGKNRNVIVHEPSTWKIDLLNIMLPPGTVRLWLWHSTIWKWYPKLSPEVISKRKWRLRRGQRDSSWPKAGGEKRPCRKSVANFCRPKRIRQKLQGSSTQCRSGRPFYIRGCLQYIFWYCSCKNTNWSQTLYTVSRKHKNSNKCFSKIDKFCLLTRVTRVIIRIHGLCRIPDFQKS